MLGDLYLRAGVNLFRFWTGKWKTIAARSGVGAGGD